MVWFKYLAVALISFFSQVPTSAYAADVDKTIQGTWKGRYAESCEAVRDVTTEDFFVLDRSNIERYEGSCAVDQTSKVKGEFIIKGICESEGETARLIMRIRMIDKNHIFVDEKQKYERCR